MGNDQTNQGATANPGPSTFKLQMVSGRWLAVATALVFFISSAFPVAASLAKDTSSFPEWWGILDVSIAFVLAALAFAVVALAQGKVNKEAEDASYRAYRILIHGIFALIVVFFVFGDQIIWINCLTGFAWRTWLLLYCLPAWFTVFGRSIQARSWPRSKVV